MDIFAILSLIGGLALFLYGMNVMGDGLTKVSGGKLEKILEKLTSNPIKAVLLGAGVTAVIQSSSATTVMVVGFVNSGIMKLSQAVGIIMGANVGTTITSWILSLSGIQSSSFFIQMLKPTSFSPILAIIGLLLLICSRREADEFIQAGEVLVNGVAVTELGTKITRNDTVTFRGKVVTLERKIYVLLNKPKDCVTTSDDPQGRLTVMDIVRNACTERIYPVGRLDRNTTGVLLLTNDGDLASKLTHPKFIKKKIYHVWLDRDVSEEDMQRIADGIELEDGPIQPDAVSYANETDMNQVGIEIHSGRNRIVRRIFEALGYRVVKLDRVYFAGLTKKNLQRGRWRYLTQQEVNMLQMGSFE